MRGVKILNFFDEKEIKNENEVVTPCQLAKEGRVRRVELEQTIRHVHFPAIDVRQDLQQLVVCEV